MLPQSVQVGTVRYAVTQDPDAWAQWRSERGIEGEAYGHGDHLESVLYLNPNLSEDAARLTLWHEIMHALSSAVMGEPDWTGLGRDRDAREETVIRMWEHATLAVLRDNPELAAYLCG